MTIAFVLGNGISRKPIDLNWLKQHGSVYGCNALYREFLPDTLIATDRPIATHIQESGYSAKNKFYTRRPIEGLGAFPVPSEYFGFSSGPIATALAARDGHRVIYLLGFDIGPTQQNLFNNIYADSDFYKSSADNPTYTGNWIKQIIRVITDYNKTNFFRVCGPTTADISELSNLSNLQHMDMQVFLNRLNIAKGSRNGQL
jgi:hypothetical protein